MEIQELNKQSSAWNASTRKHSLFISFTGRLIGCAVAIASVSLDARGDPPIPLCYEQTQSIRLIASNEHRDAIDSYVVRSDGAFAVRQYDRLVFDETPEEPPADADWSTTPIHFAYFDGKRTLYSAYSAMPLSMYERTISNEDVEPGDSIHLRACVWPLLSGLIQQGAWESYEQDSYTLTLHHLDLRIRFDRFGRIQSTIYETHTVSQSWIYSGYDSQGESRFPTTMKRTLRVKDKTGRSLLDETSSYTLSIVENPKDIAELLSFDEIAQRSNRVDQQTKDVFSPQGELLYNQNEIENAYLRAVGLKDPIRTRDILFVIIAVLAVGSIILWKTKSS